jgi:hypothetical protein
MALPLILGAGAGVGSSLIGGYLGDRAAKRAIKAQERALALMNSRIDAALGEIEGLSDEYINTLNDINANFDPFEMSRAYDSFYEEVIVPMERDYAEYVEPALQSAYSGGVTGAEGMQSGMAKEAEARSRRNLSARKSSATAQERDTNIQRNFVMDQRSRDIAKDKLSAATLAPTMKMDAAQAMFSGQQGIIEARLARDQAVANMLASLPGAASSGIQIGSGISDLLRGRGQNPEGIITGNRK